MLDVLPQRFPVAWSMHGKMGIKSRPSSTCGVVKRMAGPLQPGGRNFHRTTEDQWLFAAASGPWNLLLLGGWTLATAVFAHPRLSVRSTGFRAGRMADLGLNLSAPWAKATLYFKEAA